MTHNNVTNQDQALRKQYDAAVAQLRKADAALSPQERLELLRAVRTMTRKIAAAHKRMTQE